LDEAPYRYSTFFLEVRVLNEIQQCIWKRVLDKMFQFNVNYLFIF
jgi:hypothetical protein